MSSKFTGFILFVKDVERVAKFYKESLGFKEIINKEFPKKDWAGFDAGKFKFALHVAAKKAKFLNGFKLVIYSEKVGKKRKDLLKKGVKMGELIEYQGIEICDGEDPEGNAFQISNRTLWK